MPKIKPKMVIGLGNPGEDYKNTFHNSGFLALDFLAKNPKLFKPILKSRNFEYTKIGDTILVKSLVFMNESGNAVKSGLQYFKVKPEETAIIHDDSDIELGEYKLSFGKGSAGHKGVESVINILGTKNFWRIRIGIRKNFKTKAGDMVLKKMAKDEAATLTNVFQKIENEVLGI